METYEEAQRRYKLGLIDEENDRNERLENEAVRAENAGKKYLANFIREQKTNLKESIEYKPSKFAVPKTDAVVNATFNIPERIKGLGKYDKNGRFVTYNHSNQKLIDDFFTKNKRYPNSNEIFSLIGTTTEVKTTIPNVEEGKYSLLPFDEGLRKHEDSALLDAELQRLAALEAADKLAKERRDATIVETPEEVQKRIANELDAIKKLDEAKAMIDRIRELRKNAPTIKFESELDPAEAPPPNPNYTYESDKIGRLRNLLYKDTGVSPSDADLQEELKLTNTSNITSEQMEDQYYGQYGHNPTKADLEEIYYRISPPNYDTKWKPIFEEDFKKRFGRNGTDEEIKKEYLVMGSGLHMKDLENHLRHQAVIETMKDDIHHGIVPKTMKTGRTKFPLVSIGHRSNKEAVNIDGGTKAMIKAGEKKLGF